MPETPDPKPTKDVKEPEGDEAIETEDGVKDGKRKGTVEDGGEDEDEESFIFDLQDHFTIEPSLQDGFTDLRRVTELVRSVPPPPTPTPENETNEPTPGTSAGPSTGVVQQLGTAVGVITLGAIAVAQIKEIKDNKQKDLEEREQREREAREKHRASCVQYPPAPQGTTPPGVIYPNVYGSHPTPAGYVHRSATSAPWVSYAYSQSHTHAGPLPERPPEEPPQDEEPRPVSSKKEKTGFIATIVGKLCCCFKHSTDTKKNALNNKN